MSENKPKISVVIPVYNTQEYLRQCVDSILGQGFADMEIILVDDGSTDDSPAICDEYAGADSRIRVIHKENGGLGYARNSGLEAACGEYVNFIDSDDWWSAGQLTKILEYLDSEKPDILDFAFARNYDGDEKPQLFSPAPVRFGPDDMPYVAASLITAVNHNGRSIKMATSMCFGFYRRSLLTHRFASERKVISEDMLFKVEMTLKAKSYVYVPIVMYQYRMRAGSLTHTFRPDRFAGYKTLTRMFRDVFSASNLPYAGDTCMVYASSVHIKNMYRARLTFGKRRRLIKEMCGDPILKQLHLDYGAMTGKERLVMQLMRGNHPLLLQAVAEVFYRLKKQSD